METSERGGVLLRFADGGDAPMLAFVPASIATRVAALGSLLPVPGVRPPVVGIALADGAVVTVFAIGDREAERERYRPGDAWPVPGARRAVLCRVGGGEIALSGGAVVATGLFEAAPGGDGILWRGQMVPTLDVRSLYGQAEAAAWAGRAASARARAPSKPDLEPEQADRDEEVVSERATWLPGTLDEDTGGTR